MFKKWFKELQQCLTKGDIEGALTTLKKITRLSAILMYMGLVLIILEIGICTHEVIMTRQKYTSTKSRTLPADEDIVGDTAVRGEVDGEEHLVVCDFAKVFVSVYDELNDTVYEERYTWVDTGDDSLVVNGVYSARLDNGLSITVTKYYEDYNKPSYTVGRTVIVDYEYTLSYPYDNVADDIKNAPVVTVQ